jgi:hypothetical protein
MDVPFGIVRSDVEAGKNDPAFYSATYSNKINILL